MNYYRIDFENNELYFPAIDTAPNRLLPQKINIYLSDKFVTYVLK